MRDPRLNRETMLFIHSRIGQQFGIPLGWKLVCVSVKTAEQDSVNDDEDDYVEYAFEYIPSGNNGQVGWWETGFVLRLSRTRKPYLYMRMNKHLSTVVDASDRGQSRDYYRVRRLAAAEVASLLPDWQPVDTHEDIIMYNPVILCGANGKWRAKYEIR